MCNTHCIQYSGPSAMIEAQDCYDKDLRSNFTPTKLVKCEFFLRKGNKPRVPK